MFSSHSQLPSFCQSPPLTQDIIFYVDDGFLIETANNLTIWSLEVEEWQMQTKVQCFENFVGQGKKERHKSTFLSYLFRPWLQHQVVIIHNYVLELLQGGASSFYIRLAFLILTLLPLLHECLVRAIGGKDVRRETVTRNDWVMRREE